MNKKKIVLLITEDKGGAGQGILKVAQLLMDMNHEVAVLVRDKHTTLDFVHQYKEEKISFFEKISKKIFKLFNSKPRSKKVKLDPKYYFFGLDEISKNCSPKSIVKSIGFVPEVVISGWTSHFMNSNDLLALQKYTKSKLFLIATDMNHYTGGCHYAWDCNGYIKGCGDFCPAILSQNDKKIAKKNFDIKYKNAQEGNFQMISGSGWTLKQTQESKIFKNQASFPNINSLIDTRIMNPSSRSSAKLNFGLNEDKFYILMGCQDGNDPRKGFEYLVKSLNLVYDELSEIDGEKIVILIVSSKKTIGFEEIKFNKTHLDFITEYSRLSLLYQSVNLFVNSSVEDSGPMMVSEALACGTPVVGFDMGVVNNMVITGFNGYKAILKDSEDLAKGIKTIFQLSEKEYSKYSENGVNQVKKYSSFESAIEVFESILN